MTTEKDFVLLVLSLVIVPVLAVSLAENKIVGLFKAWAVLLYCYTMPFRVYMSRDLPLFAEDQDAVDARVVCVSQYWLFLMSGVAWIFLPDFRPVLGLGWYAYCFRMLYKLRMIPDMEGGQSSRWATVLVLGGAWQSSVWTTSHWPLVWYAAIVLLVCWPALTQMAYVWQMSPNPDYPEGEPY